MIYVLLIILLLGIIFGPQFWAKHTFQRYAKPLERIPGSGGELARHLLDRFEMGHVKVEVAGAEGDHYDPISKTVRLKQDNYDTHSLTAVAVAAHEVGHAIQHHRGESILLWRTRLVVLANLAQKVGAAAMLGLPVIALITRVPSTGLLLAVLGVGSMLVATLVHLVTLPVEIDASFGKALPILKEGEYIHEKDEAKVRRVLRAAAFTYLAASLASLLNLWRWIAILRR